MCQPSFFAIPGNERNLEQSKARLIVDQRETDPVEKTPDDRSDVYAFVEHLTGPSRGQTLWLAPGDHDVILEGGDTLRCVAHGKPVDSGVHIATFSFEEGRFKITATTGHDIWINRQKTSSAEISHLDMIEFGETGPMSRFRYCDQSYPAHWPIDDIVSDTVAYAWSSRRPFAPRMLRAVYLSGHRLAFQTTIFFRLVVTITLVALAVLGYLLFENDRRFEDRLALESQRIAAISAALSQTQNEALTPEDLGLLRAELEARLITSAERLEMLELRSEATQRVIQDSARSVVFLQVAFGLRHVENGTFLRHVVDADGNRLSTPFGHPWIDPAGTGEVAEFQSTATGFLIENTNQIATNRHVALPWTARGTPDAFIDAGLEPEILSLIAYLPGLPAPQDVALSSVSDTVDLAILNIPGSPAAGRGLPLATAAPRPGEEIVLIGYPTGLRALLAQAGPSFLEQLETAGEAEFWKAAARLAEQNLIWPLSSRGIVAHIGAEAILYDAETTMGGSGGPVLNSNGEVIAINSAVLPEFGGSNMGVPAAKLRELLGMEAVQ